MTATPEARRTAETTHVPAGAGERIAMMGTVLTFKVVGTDTGDAYAVWEAAVLPGCGPAPHVHHREEETTYVLEGDFEFLFPDGAWRRAGVGECLRTPRGVPHGFTNVGPGPGRLLVVAAPAGAEHFFAAAGRRLRPGEPPPPAAGPPSPEQRALLARTARAHGTELLGRPGPPAAGVPQPGPSAAAPDAGRRTPAA
jgi:quercetin dioxygenase-like cupin family protein